LNQIAKKKMSKGSLSATVDSLMDQVAKAATLFGTEAKALKYSDEEALGAFNVIENRAPSTEEAATRLRSFLNQIAKKKMSKGSLSATVDSLMDQVAKGKTPIELMGETRAAAGLGNLIAGRGDLAAQVQSISAANQQDLIGQADYINSDPILASGLSRAEAEGKLSGANEDRYAERENLYQALRAQYASQNTSTARRRLEGLAFSIGSYGLTDEILKGEMRWEGYREGLGMEGRIPAKLEGQIASYLERIAASNENIENNATRAPRGRAQ